MTGRLVAVVISNALMLALGTGLLPLFGLARTPRRLLAGLPLAYALGVAATGILAAELALVHVPVGRIALPLLAAASLALGLRRLERGGGERRKGVLRRLPVLAVLAVVVAFLVEAARLYAVKPLWEGDAWMIWTLRARALYDFGHPVAPIFTSALYPGLQHPLWLPALEAVDFRLLGRYDGTLVNMQIFGLAVAFVGGAWVLLRRYASPLLLAAALLAILTAPTFFNQLETTSADVPLAMLLALGLSTLAAWVRGGEPGLLPAASLFLGAGAITKSEGELFALAAFVGAALVAQRAQLRPLGLAALAAATIDLPWRIWVQIHHVHSTDYSLANLFNLSYLRGQSYRVGPVVHELLFQIRTVGSWSYLATFVLVGLAGALLVRQIRLAIFAAVWLALSFAGLVAIYWISPDPLTNHLYNSSDRTIVTLVIGGTLLVPVLLHPKDAERGLRDRGVESG